MEFYIYILYSKLSNIYYVGHTNNYQRRLDEHNNSDHPTFTSKHRPWDLGAVYFCGNTAMVAIKIERFIKKQKSRILIEKLINGQELEGVLAQLVRVPYVRN
jgi:putative endonuclease